MCIAGSSDVWKNFKHVLVVDMQPDLVIWLTHSRTSHSHI